MFGFRQIFVPKYSNILPQRIYSYSYSGQIWYSKYIHIRISSKWIFQIYSIFVFMVKKDIRQALIQNFNNYSTIQTFNNSTIQQFNNSNIQQFNNSTMQHFNNSTFPHFNKSTLQQINTLKLQIFNHSTIQQFNNSTI